MVTPDSAVTIHAFMRNELGLTGNDLLAYAVIYGYSQNGTCWYTGTREEIAEWCGASKTTISRCIAKLEQADLIERRHGADGKSSVMDYRAKRNAVASKPVQLTIGDKFVPPTPEDVDAYARERGVSEWIDGSEFCDYYGSQGWRKANGVQMTDWHKAASGWASRSRDSGRKKARSGRIQRYDF